MLYILSIYIHILRISHFVLWNNKHEKSHLFLGERRRKVAGRRGCTEKVRWVISLGRERCKRWRDDIGIGIGGVSQHNSSNHHQRLLKMKRLSLVSSCLHDHPYISISFTILTDVTSPFLYSLIKQIPKCSFSHFHMPILQLVLNFIASLLIFSCNFLFLNFIK